ncbi:RNA polymerase subunit sigma-70, partial [bacterium]|nr:RNA polymerase subunit sigma-70 [bacterium]
MSDERDVTELLLAWSGGDRQALDALVPRLYGELRRIAHAKLKHERPGHTLDTTALVNEAYLKLVQSERVQ